MKQKARKEFDYFISVTFNSDISYQSTSKQFSLLLLLENLFDSVVDQKLIFRNTHTHGQIHVSTHTSARIGGDRALCSRSDKKNYFTHFLLIQLTKKKKIFFPFYQEFQMEWKFMHTTCTGFPKSLVLPILFLFETVCSCCANKLTEFYI